ncbi:MAG: hypothetical protein FD169_710 [Bacillota bacterium]|nr:MAG: hypothetical protein FD169_710 [Bacillota bacterium]
MLSWHAGKAQVLDTEGRFITVRCPSRVAVGRELNLSRVPAELIKYIAAACLLIALCGGIWFDNYALAYVAIDINPSIELGINWRDKVVAVKALNEEAVQIIAAHNPQGLQIAVAVTKIVRESLRALPVDSEPMAIVSVSGKAKAAAIKEIVQDAVQKELTKEKKASRVVGLVVPATIREEAKDAGVSPGQYALALKATEKGSTVTTEEIRGQGLQKALENAGVDLEKVGKAAEQEKNFGQVKKEIREQVTGNSTDNSKGNPKEREKEKNPKKK